MKVTLTKKVYKALFPGFYERGTKLEMKQLETGLIRCTITTKKGKIIRRFIITTKEIISLATE